MSKKKGNAKNGINTRVSDDRKVGVTKKSSDFRWETLEDPAIDETKAEKLLKKEQKKLQNNANRRRTEAREKFLEKLKNKVEFEKSLNPVFSTYFQWPRAYDMYVIATAMSVIALCYIINAIVSAFTDGLGSFGVNLWIGIVALIDAIGLWKIQLPFRKIKSKDVKAFKGYLAVQKILNVISFVVCEILAAVLLIASIALMVASDGLSDIVNSGAFDIGEATGGLIVVNADAISGFLDIAPALFFLLAIFISVVPAIVFTYYNRALKRFISYIDELTASVESGIYRIENEPPYKSFMVLGTLSIVGALLPIYILLWSGLSEVLFSPTILLSFFSGAMFGEYLIYTAHLFRNIHRDAKNFSAMLDGTAAHELIERCDPEMLCRNGVNAEIDRLVAEGALTSQFASRIRREEIEPFRNSKLLADIREAKRAEDAQMASLLENIRQTDAYAKMDLPECIENIDLGNLFDEIHMTAVLEEMRNTKDAEQERIADEIDKERHHYNLPAEILKPEVLEKIRESSLFEEMRKAKRLFREFPVRHTYGSKSGKLYLAILDCIIVEESGDIKIVDFKTDRQPAEQFIEEYSSQLFRYKSAVLQNFGKSPASMEVYSFYLGKSIPMQINE